MATQEKPKQTPEYTALKIDVPTLSETQVQTIQLIEELKKKATTPETMKKAVEELKKLDTKNHEGLKKLAEQAIGEFEKRLETPEWQDKLYANKEIILAGAAIIAIGAWFFRDKISSSAKWGLTAVSAAAAGYIGYQYWNEQEFLKQHQGKGEKGKDEQEEPGKLPDQPKQGLEAESSDTLAAFETHESLEKTCRESYLAAVTLANKIDRGQKAWAKEDISTFTLAIDKLNELKKSTSTESVKERCDERIAFLLQYYAAPGTPPETWWDCFVASAPGTAERVLSSLFGGEIFWVSLGLGAVVYAERSRKLGVSLMKAVKEGYTGSIADAVGSKFFGAEKYSRLKVASELMDIEKAGGIRLADDLLTAGKVLKEGGTPLHEAARLAETPAFRQRWWHLRRSLSEQQQAARTYQHAVMEGAQGYRAQLDELAETMKQLNINSVEDAEKFLTKLETPRSVWHASTWTRGKETARMVKIWKGIRTFENALSAEGKALFKAFAAKQGREALLALGRQNAEHADDLVKILSDLEPVKLQPKMWDKFLKGCKKQLATCADDATRQVMVATLKQSAKETLPRQSRLLGRLTAVGVAVEFAVVLFYQYEANEIEEMVSKMEKVEDPKRIAVLNERIWTKRYAQSGVSLGMGLFMAWKGVTIPGALPLVALQLLYESLGNTASEAAERRTRSPQAWATERSRENLIKLVCMEHGVSDGDWIGKNLSWIPGIEYAPDGVTLLNNKELRKYYFTALLLQSWGVEKMEEGKSLMDEIYDTNTLEEKKSEAAQMIRQELDFIESAKPEFDPKSPIEVNHLLTQARLVALIKKDKAQLSREVEELKKLASPDEAVQKTSEFYRAFQEYADEEDPLEVEHETLVSEFQKEYFQQATEFNLNQYSALDKTGHARAEGIQKLIERNHKEPKEFLELASAEEQENYAGLISAFPLSGSLFEAPGSEKKEQVEATSTRHALESRMDEMYTLLALEQQFAGQPVRGLAPEVSAAFNDCFAFCFRYYEAVYGVPYQPVIMMDKLDEERVHEWVRSLSKERSQGIVFGKDEAGLVQYAISDSEIELNFNASQQQETQGLYSFARALGYRGPMEKALIQQYFSPDKALDQGIYFDGKEWKIVNIGIFGDMAPDFTFSKWVVDELIRGNILVRKEGYDAPILEAPASPTQREQLLIDWYEGKRVPSWEDNPLIIEFLAEVCEKMSPRMFEREDDKFYIPNDEESNKGIANIGEDYAAFLREQQEMLSGSDIGGKRGQFRKKLREILEGGSKQLSEVEAGYVILPPELIKEGYLAGFSNIGLFAYKLVGEEIHAWQIGPLPDGKIPWFLKNENSDINIDNPVQFDGLEFDNDLKATLENTELEKTRQDEVLKTAKDLLRARLKQLYDSGKLEQDRYKALDRSVWGMVGDLDELNDYIYDPEHGITGPHKNSFGGRMRANIGKMIELVLKIQGAENASELQQVFELREQVSKMKQLYLIAFLNKAAVDDSFLSYVWFDNAAVNGIDDWKKIDQEVDSQLNRFSSGELFKNTPGVGRFMEKKEAELQAYLLQFPDSGYKELYREHYMRQMSMIIHRGLVYGCTDNGINTKAPGSVPTLENVDLQIIEHAMRDDQITYPHWLSEHRGVVGEEHGELVRFDAAQYHERLSASLDQSRDELKKTSDKTKESLIMAKEMTMLCLSYTSVMEELKNQKVSLDDEGGELDDIYALFDTMLQGSLSSKKNKVEGIMNSADFETAFGYFEGKNQEQMRDFYYRFEKIMSSGVQDLSRYLSLTPDQREKGLALLNNPPLSISVIRQIALLTQKKDWEKLSVQDLQTHHFEWWALSRYSSLDLHASPMAHLMSPNESHTVVEEDLMTLRYILQDLEQYQLILDQLEGNTFNEASFPTQEERNVGSLDRNASARSTGLTSETDQYVTGGDTHWEKQLRSQVFPERQWTGAALTSVGEFAKNIFEIGEMISNLLLKLNGRVGQTVSGNVLKEAMDATQKVTKSFDAVLYENRILEQWENGSEKIQRLRESAKRQYFEVPQNKKALDFIFKEMNEVNAVYNKDSVKNSIYQYQLAHLELHVLQQLQDNWEDTIKKIYISENYTYENQIGTLMQYDLDDIFSRYLTPQTPDNSPDGRPM